MWPRIDHFRTLDVRADEQLFRFITMVAEGSWQTRKWRKAFETQFREYPELRMDSYRDELKGKSWPEYCAVCRRYEELARSKCVEIAARFRQLAKIKKEEK